MGIWKISVDDSTTSFDDVNDAFYFYATAKSCLQKGSFDLRNGSQTTRTCSIALMNMKAISNQQTITTKC